MPGAKGVRWKGFVVVVGVLVLVLEKKAIQEGLVLARSFGARSIVSRTRTSTRTRTRTLGAKGVGEGGFFSGYPTRGRVEKERPSTASGLAPNQCWSIEA